MLHPTPESFRKDLELLSQRLQALREEFRERDLLSDAQKAQFHGRPGVSFVGLHASYKMLVL